MKNSPLYQSIYSGEIEQSVFQEILACLNHVVPRFISREEYEEKYREDFLVQTGEDKFGEHYDLFLPEDLQYIELLRIIDILNKKFDIEKYARFDELIVKTKVAVGKFLKDGGKQKDIDDYIQTSGISEDLQRKIENTNIRKNMNTAKSVLKVHKKGPFLEQVIADMYGEEFEKTFFRRGVNMLRLGLMTFTQGDADSLDQKENYISERESRVYLDERERKLRDAIGINKLKEMITLSGEDGDALRISQAKLYTARRVFYALQKYPYQSHADSSSPGHPNSILTTKEMHCVGFSLIAHAFFDELGISHSLVSSSTHVYLLLQIGGKEYMFDATATDFNGDEDITYLVDNQGNIQGKVNVGEDETINHDTEEELFNSIKINNLSDYSGESMDYCKRRLILFPDDARTYGRIGKVFYEQKKYKLAGLYFFVMNTLEKGVNHSWAIGYKTRTLKKLMVEGKMDDVRKTLAKYEESLLSKK